MALVVALSTMGFECINDPIIVSVNIDPLNQCYGINEGSTTTYSDSVTINLGTLVNDAFNDKISNARVYDITIRVTGTYTGSISNGLVMINGDSLLTYQGTWSDFSTEQSLVRQSPHITKVNLGIQGLGRLLQQRPLPSVVLKSSGSLSGGTVPQGLGLCINVYAQIDANAK